MGKYRKNKRNEIKIPEKPKVGKDYYCLLMLIKKSAKLGPIRFTMVDDFGHHIPVSIEDGKKISINGRERDDGQVMDFIAKLPGDFEGLFLNVMKEKYDPELHIMPRYQLAKLTDLSGYYGKTAVVEIHDGACVKKLKVERTGAGGCYYIDYQMITQEQAETYVEENYSKFLVGMRKTVKEMKGHKHLQNSFEKIKLEKDRKAVKHSDIVDGKLQVDIDSFLPKKNIACEPDKVMTKGDRIMVTKKRGYIND